MVQVLRMLLQVLFVIESMLRLVTITPAGYSTFTILQPNSGLKEPRCLQLERLPLLLCIMNGSMSLEDIYLMARCSMCLKSMIHQLILGKHYLHYLFHFAIPQLSHTEANSSYLVVKPVHRDQQIKYSYTISIQIPGLLKGQCQVIGLMRQQA